MDVITKAPDLAQTFVLGLSIFMLNLNHTNLKLRLDFKMITLLLFLEGD